MSVPVKAVPLYNASRQTPGAFWWGVTFGARTHMLFCCPCGCGCTYQARIYAPGEARPHEEPVWAWDGNEEFPSIWPSLNFNREGQCGWHGFLTDGHFKQV